MLPMIWSRVPGPLSLTSLSGRLAFGNLQTKGARKLAQKLASREFGRAFSKIAFSKRTVRFVGKQWEVAFKHITEHFAAKTALATRKTAGVFLSAFRSRSAIEGLIKQAVKRPSNKVFTRKFVHTVVAGEPVTIVEREFSFVIGEAFKEVGGAIVKDSEKVIENGVERVLWNGDCKVLRVIYNVAGEVVSAFPVQAINAGL